MSPLYKRSNSLIPIVAAASLLGKEGFAYKINASNQAVIHDSASVRPDGVIMAVSPDGLEITGAPFGGNHGTVGVKLGANVTDLRKDLTIKADATFESDDAAGARVIVARPLETGTTDEIIEAILIYPVVYAS